MRGAVFGRWSFFRGVAQPGLACLTGGQKVGGSNPLAPNVKALCNKSLRKALFLPKPQNILGATSALRLKGITSNKPRKILHYIRAVALLETVFFFHILPLAYLPLHRVF